MEVLTVTVSCPHCGNSKLYHSGKRIRSDGAVVQRLKCPKCNCIFQENYIKRSRVFSSCHVSAKGAKNMSNQTETTTVLVDAKSKLAEYHLNMKINGYAEATIKMSWDISALLIRRGADLDKSDSVKYVISQQTWGGNRKRNVINAYTQFLKYLGKS